MNKTQRSVAPVRVRFKASGKVVDLEQAEVYADRVAEEARVARQEHDRLSRRAVGNRTIIARAMEHAHRRAGK
jgi:signal transduction histidine kinase